MGMIDVAPGEFYWYYYDGVGSVVALSKWNSGLLRGEVVERYAYGAFGWRRICDAAGGEFDAKQPKEDQEMYRTP
ncbi:MAG: hypothetical protein IH624_00675 [Phycisphaerae bacterium]|nr:hypothetical protein [Phycisphaerae bacterium]